MSYRKRAKPAQSLSVSQQLSKGCNGATFGIPFQPGHALSLFNQLKKRSPSIYSQFLSKASTQVFYPSRLVKAHLKQKELAPLSLPLPRYFISESDATDAEPRSFFHSSDVEGNFCWEPEAPYYPRCGSTGLFFSREEIVDNLVAAATELGFKSPFWIRSGHPALVSQYLEIKDGSESICLSITADVVNVSDLQSIDAALLHPSLSCCVQSGQAVFRNNSIPNCIPVGMNALTGFVSRNPYFSKCPCRGLWVSLDQVFRHNLSLVPNREFGTACTLVEVDMWELYNADQLKVPGRLGLQKCASHLGQTGVFRPF